MSIPSFLHHPIKQVREWDNEYQDVGQWGGTEEGVERRGFQQAASLDPPGGGRWGLPHPPSPAQDFRLFVLKPKPDLRPRTPSPGPPPGVSDLKRSLVFREQSAKEDFGVICFDMFVFPFGDIKHTWKRHCQKKIHEHDYFVIFLRLFKAIHEHS